MKNKIIAILLCCLFFAFAGCSSKEEKQKSKCEEYVSSITNEMTAGEYQNFLIDIFYSNLLETENAKVYGIKDYYYSSASAEGWSEFEVYDETTLNLNEFSEGSEHYSYPIYTRSESQICSSFGFLNLTQKYLESHNISHADVAKKYGFTYAILAEEVESMVQAVFHSEIQVKHLSVGGAEYNEECHAYLFNNLVNPVQTFLDNGWECVPIIESDLEELWNNTVNSNKWVCQISCLPLWYDQNGQVYDALGDPILTVEPEKIRFSTTGTDIEIREEDSLFAYMKLHGYCKTRFLYQAFPGLRLNVGYQSEKDEAGKQHTIDSHAPIMVVSSGSMLHCWNDPRMEQEN